MANNGGKRQRSSNWTREMKDLLIIQIKPVAAIIDSKLNSLSMIKKKNEAWEQIKEAFIANGHQVSAKQIRDQWNRCKQQSRNAISTFKKSQRQTGGGSPPKEPDEIDFEIEEIAKMDFEEDFSPYDGDRHFYVEERENISPNKKPYESIVIEKFETESPKQSEPISVRPNQIPAPKRPSVINKKRIHPTVTTSEELLRKRILQLEDEAKNKKIILQLQEKKERLKIQVQKKKLCLLKMKIRHFGSNN